MKKFKPSKKLGQNFLNNPKILEEIIEAAEISANNTVIEVGAGTGLLTEKLAKTGAQILAVEKDRRLISNLQGKFKSQRNVHPVNSAEGGAVKQQFNRVEIVESDILQFNPQKYKLKDDSYKIIGNIPYYLTSHLLKTVLEEWPKPKLILFMVQKEVAERIVAKPPEMSLLALAVQVYAEAEIIKFVSKENFYPKPKVDSALIKIIPRDQSLVSKNSAPNFFRLIRAGFSGKRKQLINSLSANLKIPKELLLVALQKAEINPQTRPQSLSLNEWLKLNQILFSQS